MDQSEQKGLRICIFCSANDLDDKYIQPANKIADFIASQGHTLVYGGSDRGLMKVISSRVQQGGGKVFGVSVEYLKQSAKQDADEMIVAKTLGERKQLMLDNSDILVTLAGGIGTLNEVTEAIEYKKHGQFNKPILILNTDGFYDGLHEQLTRMGNEGFFWHKLDEYITFLKDPEEVISCIKNIH